MNPAGIHPTKRRTLFKQAEPPQSTVHRIALRLTAPRFLRWVVLPHVAFFTVAWMTDAPPLIAVLRSVDIALSVAVCIAFLPSPVEAVFQEQPADKTVFLTLGIFCGWRAMRSARAGP
ncbi:hypothetical protein [Lichenibacterium ramalinae]|uniref:Uncharacterized protein n=1 Tax=Lichenibacterium ramalinae TaxID=2316527 RepID=A0A4Q2R7Z4_9HYPH|nr:hypothetical protein [Lichenibacterium ramalinae]RYB02111.1 hypothetical protein D3272_22580 [Lichenibacterium ramalinae]